MNYIKSMMKENSMRGERGSYMHDSYVAYGRPLQSHKRAPPTGPTMKNHKEVLEFPPTLLTPRIICLKGYLES